MLQACQQCPGDSLFSNRRHACSAIRWLNYCVPEPAMCCMPAVPWGGSMPFAGAFSSIQRLFIGRIVSTQCIVCRLVPPWLQGWHIMQRRLPAVLQLCACRVVVLGSVVHAFGCSAETVFITVACVHVMYYGFAGACLYIRRTGTCR